MGLPEWLSRRWRAENTDLPGHGPRSRHRLRRRRVALELLETRTLLSVAPQTYTVTSASDSGAGSLRDAVASADADTFPAGTHDTIVFDPSLASQTIDLTTSVNDPTYGPSALVVSVPLVIDGSTAHSVAIARGEQAASFRLFLVTSTGNLTLNDLSLSRGQAADPTNSGGVAYGGGAINNEGAVTLTNDQLVSNSAFSGAALYDGLSSTASLTDDILNSNTGSAIDNEGYIGNPSGYASLTLTDTTVESNNATETGGAGLYNAGNATLIDSTFANNRASYQGGALFNYGNITATGDTFYGNSASAGGVLSDSGHTTLNNSTLVSNSAVGGGVGGAVANNEGIEYLTNDTIAGNFAVEIGGIYADPLFASTGLDNSIVVGNAEINRPAVVAPVPDVGGRVGGSNNVIGDPAGNALENGSNGNIVGDGSGHPLALGAVLLTGSSGGVTFPLLAKNGGPTLTVALAPGSPAIDHGSNARAAAAGLTTDQRGFNRVVNGTVDIGAVEDQVTVTSPGPQSSLPGRPVSFPLGAFTDAGGSAGPWTVTVNWGDGTGFSQFSASAPGSLGSLPHTYAAPGVYTATVFVQDANGDANDGSFQIATADGPKVTAVQRVGRGLSQAALLSFDQALNPGAAQDVANYVLVPLGTRRPIRIRAAVYNAASHTVTLRPAAQLSPRVTYALTIHGAPPLGVADVQGLFLDGSGLGRPGTDFTAILTPPVHRVSARSADAKARR